MPPCLSDDLAVIQLAGRGDDLIAGAQGLCVPHALGGLHQCVALPLIYQLDRPEGGVLAVHTVHAGGAVRAVMEAAGVNDVLAKAIGTNNPHNVLRATMAGLAALRSAEAVSEIRGMKLEAPRK